MADTYQVPSFDSSVPELDQSYFKQQGPAQNYYTGPDSDLARISSAYTSNLGRPVSQQELDYRQSQLGNVNTNQQLDDIGNSQEAQTFGRARNEVNSTIDAQKQALADQAAQQRQQTINQLAALGINYNQQFGALDFGKQQQTSALDNLRQSILGNTDYSANQLQSKFQPAYQNAINMANRRGLLDSSVSLGLINQGYQPIQTALGDLYRTSNQKLTEAEQQKQQILSKYGFDYQGLVSKREQEAQALRDNLSLLLQQDQSQSSGLETQRQAQTYARANQYGDVYNQLALQKQAAALAQQQFGENQRQFNSNYALQQQAAGKL